MKTSAQLKQERASLVKQQGSLLETRKTEKRSFTKEEKESFQSLDTQIEALDGQIVEREAEEKAEARAAGLSGAPVGRSEGDEKDKIKKRYSPHKAMRQSLSSSTEPLDGVELEMHQEAKKQARAAGVEAQGLMMPTFDTRADEQTVTGEAGAFGGNLVATQHQPLIEYLRPEPVLEGLGARVLRGLTGNLAFPTNNGGVTATWEDEIAKVGRTRNAYGKKAMAPNRLAAKTVVSLQNLIQSNINLESQTMEDINAEIANAVDLRAINGVTGILNDADVNAVVGGTDGAAPTWPHIVDLETSIMIENATKAKLAYLINYGTKGFLKKTPHAANNAGYLMNGNNEINGYKAGVSNLVPNDLTKGTLAGAANAGIFGDFNQLLIGNWGFVSMILDEVTLADEGLIKITTNSFWDILVRQPKAFAVIKDWDLS